MTKWILQYWIEVLFGLLCGGLGGLGILIKKQFKRQDAVEKGIQALLRDRIVFSYYKYSERGNISLHGLEAMESMYTEYHNLGGNGAVTKLMKDVRKLEVVDE